MSDTAVNLLDNELSVDSVEEYPAEGQPGGLFDNKQQIDDDEDSTSHQTSHDDCTVCYIGGIIDRVLCVLSKSEDKIICR